MLAVPHMTAPMQVRDARPADAPALARTRVASWHATYRGTIPADELARVTYARDFDRFDRALSVGRRLSPILVVADRRGTVFGYAWSGPQRDRRLPFGGEIYELYLHPRFLRRGGGTLLLRAAIWRLVEIGLHPVMVWVLAKNPACHFYDACGGRRVGSRTVDLGGRAKPTRDRKIAYGWDEGLPLPPPI